MSDSTSSADTDETVALQGLEHDGLQDQDRSRSVRGRKRAETESDLCQPRDAARAHGAARKEGPGTQALRRRRTRAEIRHSDTGACAKHGAAPEARETAATRATHGAAREAFPRRWWLCAALTLLVLAIAMAHRAGWASPAAAQVPLGWIEAILATIVVLWGGRGLFAYGGNGTRAYCPRRYVLASLGAGVAWCYSVVALLAPEVLPTGFRGASGAFTLHFDWAAVIVTLTMLVDTLERRRARRSGGEALMARGPVTARRIQGDGKEHVPVDDLRVDEPLRIRPGKRFPEDGVLVAGPALIDTSPSRDAAEAETKADSDEVVAGGINSREAQAMRVRRAGADAASSWGVRRAAQAQGARLPAQIANRTATLFVPIVMAVAAFTFAAWALWGAGPALIHALGAAVAVLTIACPAALALASSLPMLTATTRGARAGVLFRDAAAIQALREVDTLVIGKTGTLTGGRVQVTGVIPQPGADEREALRLAAAVEAASAHPLGRAIVGFARHYGFDIPAASELATTAGRGVSGRVEAHYVLFGNESFLKDNDVPLDNAQRDADRLRAKGMSTRYLAVDGELIALIGTTDPARPEAESALRALERAGLKVIMATGDARATAVAVASALGIEEVVADASAQDKAALVQRLRAAGRRVAAAGDSPKDAPALAAADVGIAMEIGPGIATQDAAVTVVDGTLDALLRARELSRAAVRNVREERAFVVAYNVIGIPVAAGLLYPFFGLLLSPMVAALATCLASSGVIIHALRLRGAPLSAPSARRNPAQPG